MVKISSGQVHSKTMKAQRVDCHVIAATARCVSHERAGLANWVSLMVLSMDQEQESCARATGEASLHDKCRHCDDPGHCGLAMTRADQAS